MLLFAVSVLVVAQSSSEIPEGLMNNPVILYYFGQKLHVYIYIYIYIYIYKLCIEENWLSIFLAMAI